ncbi:MAG TPA: hypothetical protein PKL08_00850 [Thermoanaerobaculaceae bacterium]|nr:hypothetical protein [Thermoanaerobaculaceae bacterium]
MPQITVPKDSIQFGPGYLYRAPLGSLLPGQTAAATVTNKALATNVVTLTTSAAHGLVTGDPVVVSIGDATFDGNFILTGAPTTTTLTYAKTAANVTSAAATGTVQREAGGTVAGSVFTDAWPAAWIPWGVTREGSTFSYQLSTSEVTVAEYLNALAIVEDSVAIGVDFDVAQVTAKNFAAALNNLAGTRTVSGTGATLLTKVSPPAVGQSVRTMLGWESNDGTERAFFYQCLQAGNLQVQRRKGSNNASLPVSYRVEQPATGDAFNQVFAGTTRVGS